MSNASLPRVLCVDDEPGLLRSLRWLLRGQYEVAVAGSGLDGLALLSAEHFDVVISDQRMPGMTGTEFLERAKRVSPRSIRLLLTGYSDFNAVLSSVNESEIFRFISKPWDNQKLLDTVSDAAKVARMTQTSWVDCQDSLDADGSDTFHEGVLVFDNDSKAAAQWQASVKTATNIVCTSDIGEAVNQLTRRKIAVLITDIQGARSQQMDLIRAIRRNQPQVVVLVYSQERDSAVIGRLINEGQIYRFIAKPAGPEYLNRTLRSALTRHRQLLAVPERTARHQAQVSDDLDFEIDFASAGGQLPLAMRRPLTGARSWLQRLFH
ncbi:response regulator [Hydrogenophaga sp.]|uniref:response regulator n=1 Tax=Hydrogenophaga sp. TaxID=1904254 RepID=UPI002FCC3147